MADPIRRYNIITLRPHWAQYIISQGMSFAMSSVEIVNDVRQVCLSNNKMTEKQRLEIVFGIRPKLKLMNKKLKRLIRAAKYTRLSDVWAEIDYGARSEVDKPTIVQRCKERWRRNARP